MGDIQWGDIAKVLTAAGAFLTALFAGIRWLLVFSHRLATARQNERMKKLDSTAERLDKTVSIHNAAIERHAKQLDKYEKEMAVIAKELKNAQELIEETRRGLRNNEEGFGKITKAVKDFVETQERRFVETDKKLETFGKIIVKLAKP